MCTHHQHINAECYKQHPNLAPSHWAKSNPNNQHKSKDTRRDKSKRQFGRKHGGAAHSTDTTIEEDSDDQDTIKGGQSNMAVGQIVLPKIAVFSKRDQLTSQSIIYDSGTSYHFFNNRAVFKDLKVLKTPVTFSQAVGVQTITSSGTVIISIKNAQGKSQEIKLSQCLYSLNSSYNLISVGRLYRKAGIELDRQSNQLMVKNRAIGSILSISYVDVLQDAVIMHQSTPPAKNSNVLSAPAVAQPKANTTRWHQRLGHSGNKILSLTSQLASGLEDIDTSTLNHCETCKLSKSQRIVSRDPRQMPKSPLDEIHVDTVGPIVPQDINGNQYLFVLTDSRTKFHWVISVRHKSDGPNAIRAFIA